MHESRELHECSKWGPDNRLQRVERDRWVPVPHEMCCNGMLLSSSSECEIGMSIERHQIQLVGVSDVTEGVAQDVSRLIVLILEIVNVGVAKHQTRKHLNYKNDRSV
jgi:hypothetical protein